MVVAGNKGFTLVPQEHSEPGYVISREPLPDAFFKPGAEDWQMKFILLFGIDNADLSGGAKQGEDAAIMFIAQSNFDSLKTSNFLFNF